MLLDCANGVGAPVISELINHPDFRSKLKISLINCDKSPANLNNHCGAEHLKEQHLPHGWEASKHAGKKCCSFDGDADRQIYFFGNEKVDLSVRTTFSEMKTPKSR